ncbi:hypothetical protein BC332_34740 [Capsicum chinense]|nr:hypothetical protein BC332_34740 [Capsicum chinense]
MTRLRIVAFNCNGLLSHANEIEAYVRREKIDILLLNETHLTSQMYYRLRGYEFYRTDSPLGNSWGGAGLLIRSGVSHYLDDTKSLATKKLQTVGVTLPTKNGEIHIASIYSPPSGGTVTEDEYKDLITKLGPRFILGGDFNAKHTYYGSKGTTAKGTNLVEASLSTGCDFLTDGVATYYPTDPDKTPDLIDFFLTRNISRNFLQFKGAPPFLTNNKTDWVKFKRILVNRIEIKQNIDTKEELENQVNLFTSNVRHAALLSTPPIKTVETDFKLPPEILEAIRERRRLRNKWKRSRFPDDREAFNRASRKLRAALADLKQERLSEFIKSLSPGRSTDYSLWRSIRYLKRAKVHVPPIKLGDNKWAISPIQKAEAFSNFLAEVFKPNPEPSDPEDTLKKKGLDFCRNIGVQHQLRIADMAPASYFG